VGLDLFEVLRRSGLTDPCAEAAVPDSPKKTGRAGAGLRLAQPERLVCHQPVILELEAHTGLFDDETLWHRY